MSYAVLAQTCGESIPEPSSMFDSTQAAELVALCLPILPGEMAPFTYVFLVIAKSLRVLQRVAINAAPRHNN